MPKNINIYKNIFKILLISLLTGFFIIWILDVINQKPQDQIIEKEPAEFKNSEIISGIAKATDGDSIIIGQKSIRLIGIDAPEYKQKCLDKDYFEYNCGEISADFLKKLVGGKNIICYYQQKDIYQRYLGICYLEKLNINQEILKNGMAIIYNPVSADEKLKQLELEAKANKIGVWQGGFLEPKEYRRKNKKHLKNETKN